MMVMITKKTGNTEGKIDKRRKKGKRRKGKGNDEMNRSPIALVGQ